MNERQLSTRDMTDTDIAKERRDMADRAMGTMSDSTPVYHDSSDMPRFAQEATLTSGVGEYSSMGATSSPEGIDEAYTASIDDTPDMVEEKKAKDAISSTVDISALSSALSDSGKIVLEGILSFMRNTGSDKDFSGSEGLKRGAMYVVAYWHTLDTLFNRLDNKDFAILYRALLDLYAEHSEGVFNPEKVYRFAEEWTMSDVAQQAYKRLNMVMFVTCHMHERYKSVRELNWEYSLAYGLTSQAKNRLRGFYEL